jgi:RNA polymerase sigma-70 factor (ECF subfamily)
MQTTSHTLLAKLQTPHQPDAWDRFVKLYAPLLRHWAKQQGFQEADAEDLTQEIFVKLMNLILAYSVRPGHSFRSWLFAVARNQGKDFRRRRATRRQGTPDGLSRLQAREDDEFGVLDEQEYRQILTRRALELIRPDFGEATWRAFESVVQRGLSAQQTASQLGITPNAVCLARNRVLTRLREELEGFLD